MKAHAVSPVIISEGDVFSARPDPILIREDHILSASEGLSADVTSETKGVGSKTGEKSFTDRFLGLTGNCDAIDGITGATYSSKAVKAGVNAALAAYAAIH